MPRAIPKLTLVIDRVLYRTRPAERHGQPVDGTGSPEEQPQPVSLVDEAIAGGVSLVQLRYGASQGDGLEAFAIAQRLREITRDRVPFVVTDDLHLAEKCHADGVLLTSEHSYHPNAVRAYIRSTSALVGCFVRSVRGASRAERGGADYVQVGPVFGPDGDSGIALLRKVHDAIHLPIVAFGGIATSERVRIAIDAGASGIAVSEPILAADDPRAVAALFAEALGAA
ncbi:MAG: thiamine phosphate synthase [Capsulimonadaceae bacterium]|nr:thiamine phosphate synthase [Capsulimonadaceae bacterium]